MIHRIDAKAFRASLNADLTEFYKEIYPIYAEHGFSVPEAWQAYISEAIGEAMGILIECLPSAEPVDDNEGDEWQGSQG